MAELKDIMDAVLRDTVRAQHQTNMYAQSLSDSYQQGGRIYGFNVPAVSIGEIALDFCFAVKGELTYREEENVNYREVNRMLRNVASECVKLLLKTLVKTIQDKAVNYKEKFGFVDSLEQNKPFVDRLTKRFSSVLIEHSANLTDETTMQLIPDAVTSLVLEVAIDQILDHEDLKGLFAMPENKKLYALVKAEFKRVLEKETDDFIRESSFGNFRHRHQIGSLNVEMDAEALSQLPENAIQKFHIKVYPQLLQNQDKNS
jgi:DNA-directed RNA polymerase subunit F